MRVLTRLWPHGWYEIPLIRPTITDTGKEDTVQIEKSDLPDFPPVYLPEGRLLEIVEHVAEAAMKALEWQTAELCLAPDVGNVTGQREILEIPLEFRQRDRQGNVAEIRFDDTSELAGGFIPDPRQDGAAFALISCQYPAGFLDGPAAREAYRQMAERIDAGQENAPRFTVLTGDQVYVDPTAGLYDPSQADDRYERPYLAWLREEHVRGVLRRVPSFMMLDDHEIGDNWEPATLASADNQALRDYGRQSYIKYQRGLTTGATLSFTFDYGDSHFFMLDTRTERQLRKASNAESRTLIHPTDLAALATWLQDNDGPKFIVSPSMLLPRHRESLQWHEPASAVRSDGWDGFPGSLFKMLELIAENDFQNVVFLSGDEHRGCVATIDITDVGSGQVTRTHSIHTQGAYAPFPFANSFEQDFIGTETFTFDADSGTTYRCDVDTVFQPQRNGVTYLNPRPENGVWKLDYEFADNAVQTLQI